MNKLNLKNINLNSPYVVYEREDKQHEFYFWSDNGVEYDIGFAPNNSIIPSGAIEVGINNREHKASHRDPNFLKTFTAIIEEFFACNDDVMLYLAETGDGKQQFRNRLFVIWFNTYENRHQFVMKTAEGKLEDQDNFMALIAKVDNPRLNQAMEEFDETAEILFGEPPHQHITKINNNMKKDIKIYYSKKRAVAVLLAIPVLCGLMFWVFYHFNANLWSYGSPLIIALIVYGSICYKIYKQRVCMTITDEYLEINSKDKWTVCFCDVEEFYRADYDVIGIRYKKDNENCRPDDEIPTRTMDINPQKLLYLLNKKIFQAK